MVTLTFDIDSEVKKDFKKYCLDKQVTMRQAFELMIQTVLKKHKKK